MDQKSTRLDFATSGVLCMARSKAAAVQVNRLFEHRLSPKERIFIELMTSDRKLKASREGLQ